jgi:cytochrome b subunit of formate dehydrogenase
VDGLVPREWARHHHPNWYRALLETAKIEPEKREPAEPDEDAE